MNKVLIEQILNVNCIRYDALVKIINKAFVGCTSSHVDIYIDLYSILKPLYKSNYDLKDYSIVTSSIINMCAHYRKFFRYSYDTETTFYIVYSKNCPYINKQFYSNYNGKNEYMFSSNAQVTDMIQYNVKLLKLLCSYLPDIHFISGNFETGVIIYDMICRNKMKCESPHIILTRDVYNYQIIPTYNDVIILRPKKKDKQDVSYYIDNSNVLYYFIKDREVSIDPNNLALMPGLISVLMALSSVPNRNIKMLTTITKAIKELTIGVNDLRIFNGYNSDPYTIWNNINTDNFDISAKDFEFRYKAIDVVSQQRIYMNTPEAKSIKLLNLVDPDTIRLINNQYFVNNPLDLEGL